MRHQEGSLWHHWDLQVHTPYSILNSQFSNDFEKYAAEFFRKAYATEAYLVGVTDYFLCAGYKDLMARKLDRKWLAKHLTDDERAHTERLVLLPNIELRSDIFVDGNRVNFHVVFSEELEADEIESNFLNQLKFKPDAKEGQSAYETPITEPNLNKYGAKLKKEHSYFSGKPDLWVGMANAVVDLDDALKLLNNPTFLNRYIVAIPVDEDLSKISWDGQGHGVRKRLYKQANVWFASNEKTINFGLGKLHTSEQEYLEEFDQFKACMVTSDSHKDGEMFSPKSGKRTWCKADVSFEGLRQVLIEPGRRCRISENNPYYDEISGREAKTIKEVMFTTNQSVYENAWFDQVCVKLNANMVAIIGNKGSGKSALSDSIGLCGNSKLQESFSFLNDRKFCQPRRNLGSVFGVKITWVNDEVTLIDKLSETVKEEAPELVRYLPQNHIEKLCTEVTESGSEDFERELKSVIFQHIPIEDRLGKTSLDELIEYKAEAIDKSRERSLDKLRKTNRKIVKFEKELSQKNIDKKTKLLDQRKIELRTKFKSRPALKRYEGSHEGVDKDRAYKLLKLKTEATVWEVYRDRLRDELIRSKEDKEHAERIIALSKELPSVIDDFLEGYIDDMEAIGIHKDEFLKVEINIDKASERQIIERETIAAINRFLLAGSGIEKRLEEINLEIKEIETEIEEPLRQYRNRRAERQQWREEWRELLGGKDLEDSYLGIRHLLDRIDQKNEELETEKQVRRKIADEIFNNLLEKCSLYAELYKPLEAPGVMKSVGVDEYGLSFGASLRVDGFIDGFLSYINQGRRGSFCGKQEGYLRAKNIVDSNLVGEDSPNYQDFLHRLDYTLHFDVRQEQVDYLDVFDQLVSGNDVIELYDYIWSMRYLVPTYDIRWEGKHIGELSPGERGMLLLIFYLMVDVDDRPLIIDQPEENLDNQTIYRLLVKAIQETARRRQLIIVTHNPNLAVVCDADQVIVAHIDKHNNNVVTYSSGAIENPNMITEITEILEGSKPAFKVRDKKYQLDRAWDRP